MFIAEFLRILRNIPAHCFIEIVIERAECDMPGARVRGLTLQRIKQMSHKGAMPLLHLLLRDLAAAPRSENDTSPCSRQVEQGLPKQQACVLRVFLLPPTGADGSNIQQRENVGSLRIVQVVVYESGNV